jgi:hypothetical protein
MQPTCEVILDAAMKLPESERLLVVSKLLETLPAEDSLLAVDDVALVDELDRRFADRDGSMTWSELRAKN